jgi:hypothetical protein
LRTLTLDLKPAFRTCRVLMNGKRPDSYREVLGAVKTQIWKFSRHIVVSSFGRWFCSLAHGKGPDRSTSSHRSRVQSMKRVHWRQHRRGMSITPVIAAKGQSITPAAHVGSNLSPVRSSQASTLPAGQREHCSLLPSITVAFLIGRARVARQPDELVASMTMR